MAIYFSLIIAMFVTMALIPLLMKSAVRLQFVDIPNERKVHQGPIPRIGGIAMVLGACLPILLWLTMLKPVVALLIGFAVILFFGTWDDRKDLDYRLKLLGQLIAIFVVVFYGEVRISIIPLVGAEPVIDSISIPLTILFILGITNAINLSDGLDGLAGGTTLVTLGIIGVMAHAVGDIVVLLSSLAIIGSILGFLRFNTHPATVFMGDGGSQFLGFSVAVLAVMLTQNPEAPISAALPVLLLSLPILDTFIVIHQRISEGRSPFSADKNHIHHRFLEMGLDHYEAVALIYFIQSGIVILAYYMRFESDLTVMGAFLLIAILATLFFRYARENKFQINLHNKSPDGLVKTHRSIMKWDLPRAKKNIHHISIFLIAALIFIYFTSCSLNAQNVSNDIGIISILAAILLTGSYFFKRKKKEFTWLDRASIYLICTYIVYLQHIDGLTAAISDNYILYYFSALTVFIFVALYCTTHSQFEITPFDFIVVFVAFFIPSIPEIISSQFHVGEMVAKLIVLYYGIELIITFTNRYKNLLRVIIIFFFFLLGFQSFM